MHPALVQAIRSFNSGDLEAAERACHQAQLADPLNPQIVNLLGAISGSVGRADLAVEYLRRAVEMAPREISFKTNYANALMNVDRWDDAREILQAVVAAAPGDAFGQRLLGTALARDGELEEAARTLQAAAELEPDSYLIHFNLGETYRRLDERDKAIESFRRASECEATPDVLNNLAGLLLDRGDFVESVNLLGTVLRKAPNSAQGFHNLGIALEAAGKTDDAIRAFRNAVRVDPSAARSRYELAMSLTTVGRLDEASIELDGLAELDPDNYMVTVGKARLHERRGQIQEAFELLEAEYGDHPDTPTVAMAYANVLEQLDRAEDSVACLERVLESNETVAADGIGIRYSLGKMKDKLGQYDSAMEDYQRANEKKKEALLRPFEPEHFEATIRHVRQNYSNDRFASLPRSTCESDRPIFIVGVPRSGTSLLEQMLSCHSKVSGAGELNDIGHLFMECHMAPDKLGEKADNGAAPGGQEVEVTVTPAPSWQELDSQYLSVERLDDAATKYLATLDGVASEGRVTDKMPSNFLSVGFIRLLFPNARILHSRRHPLDTCLSCYFQNFFVGNGHSYDLAHMGIFYRHYVQLMRHWHDVDGVEFLDVDYGALVNEPEETVRSVLEYCGLEFEEACLRFYESKRIIDTASYQQVRKPIYKSSLNRWQKYETHLEPLIEALGPEIAYDWQY